MGKTTNPTGNAIQSGAPRETEDHGGHPLEVGERGREADREPERLQSQGPNITGRRSAEGQGRGQIQGLTDVVDRLARKFLKNVPMTLMGNQGRKKEETRPS